MAKRFTATEKWDEEWFCRLTAEDKIIWLYLCDKCNCAGFYEINPLLIGFHTGCKDISPAKFIKISSNMIIRNGWVWLTKFLDYQYPGGLSLTCRPHIPIIKILEQMERTFPEVKGYIDVANGTAPFTRGNCHRVQTSNTDRFKIFERDNFTCQYCGRKSPEVSLEVDHKKSIKDGGDNSFENLVTACFSCNNGKSSKTLSNRVSNTLKEKDMDMDMDKDKAKDKAKIIGELHKDKDIIIIPDWIDKEAWKDFSDMRIKIRKPMTRAAIRLTIEALEKLKAQGQDPKTVLNQSIQRSWQGVFPLSEDFKKKTNTGCVPIPGKYDGMGEKA